MPYKPPPSTPEEKAAEREKRNIYSREGLKRIAAKKAERQRTTAPDTVAAEGKHDAQQRVDSETRTSIIHNAASASSILNSQTRRARESDYIGNDLFALIKWCQKNLPQLPPRPGYPNDAGFLDTISGYRKAISGQQRKRLDAIKNYRLNGLGKTDADLQIEAPGSPDDKLRGVVGELGKSVELSRTNNRDAKITDKPIRQSGKPSAIVQKWQYYIADHKDDRLSRGHLAVLGYLYDQFRVEWGCARPSLSKITTFTELHRATVMRCLNDLEEWGYFSRMRSTGGRNQRTSYTDLLSRAEQRHAENDDSGGSVTAANDTAVSAETAAYGAAVSAGKLPPTGRHATFHQNQNPLLESEAITRAHERARQPMNFSASFEIEKERMAEDDVHEHVDSAEHDYPVEPAGLGTSHVSSPSSPEISLPAEKATLASDESIPARRRGRGSWEDFFDQFYCDPFDEADPALVNPIYNLADLSDEFGFDDTLACHASFERFRKRVQDTNFPGDREAFSDLRKWFALEFRKRLRRM